MLTLMPVFSSRFLEARVTGDRRRSCLALLSSCTHKLGRIGAPTCTALHPCLPAAWALWPGLVGDAGSSASRLVGWYAARAMYLCVRGPAVVHRPAMHS